MSDGEKKATGGWEALPTEMELIGRTRRLVLEPLTTEDKATLDVQLHALLSSEARLEDELKRVKDILSSRIKEITAERTELHRTWVRGTRDIVVGVSVYRDMRREPGEIVVQRDDTGEVIARRPCKAMEQQKLFADDLKDAHVEELDESDALREFQRLQDEREKRIKHLLEPLELSDDLIKGLNEIEKELSEQAKKTQKKGKKPGNKEA